MKASTEFVKESFSGKKVQEKYIKSVLDIGLWESEKIIFKRFINDDSKILDIGCGTGRTTFGLYKLGYKDVIGLDLTPKMIESAKTLQQSIGSEFEFIVGNACDLNFQDNTFDICIFSFNGFMQIPQAYNRLIAMKEINRVLKPGGHFIFTTHDRANKEWLWFWEEEKKRWKNGDVDTRLYEFGDRIILEEGRETFLHFPTRSEVLKLIHESNFIIIYDGMIFDIADEPEVVRNNISDCRFWVIQKVIGG